MAAERHYRITIVARRADGRRSRLMRYHEPVGSSVVEAAERLVKALKRLQPASVTAVSSVMVEFVDEAGRVR